MDFVQLLSFDCKQAAVRSVRYNSKLILLSMIQSVWCFVVTEMNDVLQRMGISA
jgi:hypothetical protein